MNQTSPGHKSERAFRRPGWAAERGSALPTVLVFVLVVSVTVGLVLLVQVLQDRFIRRDVQHLQARYAAEAGVYRALSDLEGSLRSLRATYDLPGAARCSVQVEPFGGFARVYAWGQARGEEARLRALAGEKPPSAFRFALLLGDVQSSFTLTGAATIYGSVVVGPRGVERSDFRGKPFTGTLKGEVRRKGTASVPAYDTTVYHRTARRAERLLETPPEERGASGKTPSIQSASSRNGGGPIRPNPLRPADRPSAAGSSGSLWTRGRRVRVADGDLTLTEADSSFLRGPALIIAKGTLALRGSLRAAPGSVFLADSSLSIGDMVRGRGALFYARDTLRVGGTARLSGQFLSRSYVGIRGEARLRYPSVTHVARPEGRIRIGEQARVDGLVLHPSTPPSGGQGREVIVEGSAMVRGGIYNRSETTLWGQVSGSVLTGQIGFYRSPTHYVGWLKDGTIRRPTRPENFVVPYGFEKSSRPAVLGWNVLNRDAAPSPQRRGPR